jgi:lysophospholipase L1-like esterase
MSSPSRTGSVLGFVGLLAAALVAVVPAVVPVAGAPAGAAEPSPQYYVSLGDSYAAGYQPTGPGTGHTTTNGFAYQVPALAARRGYHLRLANFGCGGATTTSIIDSAGCPLLGPGGVAYPDVSQAAAAEQFLDSHRGKIGLITVSIGGNDITGCATQAQPVQCVTAALGTIDANLTTLLTGLRNAAGPKVPIVGTTYPDVVLGTYTSGQPAQQALAKLSVTVFKSAFNPALRARYEAAGGRLVDVTAATGAYGSFARTTRVAPYGTLPTPVARVCQLTYYCQYRDIHPRTPGYAIIAHLVVGTLPRQS